MIDATKIKVGQKIRLRNGEVKTVTECRWHQAHKTNVVVNGETYTPKGFYSQLASAYDIVEIIPTETSEETPIDATKIEVGDKVRLRNGETHTVTDVSHLVDDTYPVEVVWVGGGCTYTRDGFYWEGYEDYRDIVEIIPAETSEETPIDVTKIKVGDTVILRSGQKSVVKKVIPAGETEESHRELIGIELENPAHKSINGHILTCPRVYYHANGRTTLKQETSSLDIVEHIPAISEEEPTMTLRDQFAMAALSALLQGASTKAAEESVAKDAYFFADKMMQARKENN